MYGYVRYHLIVTSHSKKASYKTKRAYQTRTRQDAVCFKALNHVPMPYNMSTRLNSSQMSLSIVHTYRETSSALLRYPAAVYEL